MALYPTPTGQRMPYDRDGSAVFKIESDTGVVTAATTAQAQTLNDESSSVWDLTKGTTGSDNDAIWGVLFPETCDLVGYFIRVMNTHGNLTIAVQTSTNSTTGQDGTWTTQVSVGSAVYAPGATVDTPLVTPDYRSTIQALSVPGIKGVRFVPSGSSGNSVQVAATHFYGQPSSGQNPDSLRIWQPVTNAEVTTVFDFGDIARGTAATQQFRVHNQSATKTASTITVSMETLTDASPTLIGQYQLSTDNVTFANSISIPNLGPGGTSAVLYVKDTVAAGAQTGVWAARIVAAAGTFA